MTPLSDLFFEQSTHLAAWLKDAEMLEDSLDQFFFEKFGDKVAVVFSFDQAIDTSDQMYMLDCQITDWSDNWLGDLSDQCLVFAFGSHMQDFQSLVLDRKGQIHLSWHLEHLADPSVKRWSDEKTTLLKKETLEAFKEFVEQNSFQCVLPPDEETRILLIDQDFPSYA